MGGASAYHRRSLGRTEMGAAKCLHSKTSQSQAPLAKARLGMARPMGQVGQAVRRQGSKAQPRLLTAVQDAYHRRSLERTEMGEAKGLHTNASQS